MTVDLLVGGRRLDREMHRPKAVANGSTDDDSASISRYEGHHFDVVHETRPRGPNASLRRHQPWCVAEIHAEQRLAPNRLEWRKTTGYVSTEGTEGIRLRARHLEGPPTLAKDGGQQLVLPVFGDEERSLLHQYRDPSRRVGFCESGA